LGSKNTTPNSAKIKLYDPQARNSFGNRSFEEPITTERERENRIIRRSLLVMDTVLTCADLQVSSEVQKRS